MADSTAHREAAGSLMASLKAAALSWRQTGPFTSLGCGIILTMRSRIWSIPAPSAQASHRAVLGMGNARLSHYRHVGRELSGGAAQLPRLFSGPWAAAKLPRLFVDPAGAAPLRLFLVPRRRSAFRSRHPRLASRWRGAPRRRRGPGLTKRAIGAKRRLNETRILAAAEQVFAERGYSAASTASIAALAGLPKANLHYYFRTKQALYRR